MHGTNSEKLIALQEPLSLTHVAVCDGGGGALGHPIEFIQLDKSIPKPQRSAHTAA